MEFYLSALMLGICLSAMSLGIFISMKIFKIPDITTDGSFTLGAIVTALLLPTHLPFWLIIPITMLAGALAGCITGLIHTKLKIDTLLAGILVMTALYSINLSSLGRSNVPFIHTNNLFAVAIFANDLYNQLLVGVGIILLLTIALAYLLKTDFGIAMRATGSSPTMVRAFGTNDKLMKIIGLSVANGLTALSGLLMAEYQSFADINMGIGIVITGLGAVLIADALIGWLSIHAIYGQLLLVVFASILFQLVLAAALMIGVDPNMLKLVTALFVLLIVVITKIKTRASND